MTTNTVTNVNQYYNKSRPNTATNRNNTVTKVKQNCNKSKPNTVTTLNPIL